MGTGKGHAHSDPPTDEGAVQRPIPLVPCVPLCHAKCTLTCPQVHPHSCPGPYPKRVWCPRCTRFSLLQSSLPLCKGMPWNATPSALHR